MAQGLIVALTTDPASVAGNGSHGVLYVRIKNRGAGTVYLGSSSVTTAAGYALTTADPFEDIKLLAHETLWGMSASSGSVNVLRTGETTS